MASNSSSSSFSRDQLLCSICLDVLVQPVSTPCGHNFCMDCIKTYWDSATDCFCPYCSERFKKRPDLKVNTFILEVVKQFQLQQLSENSTRPLAVEAAAVSEDHSVHCDVCTSNTREAFMSCIQCRKSYCHDHLKSHETNGALRAHTLVAPLENLEVCVCQEHQKLHLHFCRDDGQLLCDMCTAGRHARHNFVPVEKACQEKRSAMVQMEAKALLMMDKQRQRVGVLKEAMSQNRTEIKDLMSKFEESFEKLLCELQQVQDWLTKVTQEKQEADERPSDKMIVSIEKGIVQLRSTVEKVQKLKNNKNQMLLLLQEDVALPITTGPQVMSRSTLVQDVRMFVKAAVSKMHHLVESMSRDLEVVWSGERQDMTLLQDVLQYHEDILLDHKTAHPMLMVSKDKKQVRYLPHPNVLTKAMAMTTAAAAAMAGRFTKELAVLGTRGFFGQRFYFQVFVGHKKEWCLGVATASILKTSLASAGQWIIHFQVDRFKVRSCPVHIGKVEVVGVFVDYHGSKVSFYDTQRKELIYSFTDCHFKEELFPYFNPCDTEFVNNLDPMVIVPVSRLWTPVD